MLDAGGDLTTDGHRGGKFEYRGWLVHIEVTGQGTGFAGHADLYLKGDHKCRVVRATSSSEHLSFQRTLEAKAREFIDEWLTRSESGPPGPGEA